MRNKTGIAIAGVAVLAGGWVAPAAGAAGPTAGEGAADSIPACGGKRTSHVLMHRDVDGDGLRDAIVEVGTRLHRVTVAVRINGGGTVRRTVKGQFVQVLGANRIDSRRGVEIVVANRVTGGKHGALMQARVLAYRRHHLFRLGSPTGGMEWKSYGRQRLDSGWTHHRAHGHRYLTHRTVRRVGHSKRYAGKAVDFRRRHGQWRRAQSRALNYKRIVPIVGWKMRGVQSWIGC